MKKIVIIMSVFVACSAIGKLITDLRKLQSEHSSLEDIHLTLSDAHQLSLAEIESQTVGISIINAKLDERKNVVDSLEGELDKKNRELRSLAELHEKNRESRSPSEFHEKNSVLLWSDISDKHIGKTVTVRGTAFPEDRGGSVLVYFSGEEKTPFYIYIADKVATRFAAPPVGFLLGREIDVTGTVTEYKGSLQIKLIEPGDIECTDGTVVAANPLPTIAQVVGDRAVGSIRFVTWNVENLFDAKDDYYRSDESMMTSEKEVDYKMQKIASVLNHLNADIVALQEVENRGVLSELNRKYLKDLGYEVVLFEGNDSRGIDNALLTRLPVEKVSSYRHSDYEDKNGDPRRFGRDLLQVRIGGALNADVFVVHFKAQPGGAKSDTKREAEALKVLTVISDEMRGPKDYRVLIAGDFNEILKGANESELSVRYFVDKKLASKLKESNSELYGNLALGELIDVCSDSDKYSYNKKPYQSRIDFVLCSPSLAEDVLLADVVNEIDGINLELTSDHYPVVVEFNKK